ncbi:MAG: c-type cytochrome [Bacteroidota bacterium]
MKKFLKFTGYTVLVIVLIVAGLITYVKTALPDVGNAEDLKVERTPERIERGRYLANSVTACMDCHSTRDWTKFSGPSLDGTLGKGGERFDHSMGFPGTYFSRNITPAGISRYTDGELYRVITTGVTKEGKAMFPVMPYPYYGKMDPEDIKSIIAYLRTLPPIPGEVPESTSDFPMSVIINTIPGKPAPQTRPNPTDRKAYGAYLVNAAGCIECHTQAKQGQIIKELAFSGGRDFKMPDGSVMRTPNITPDPKTGIGNWNEEAFINRFKAYAPPYQPHAVAKGEFQTIMPWMIYANMTKDDLGAIYTYLRTLPPRENAVVKFTPPGTVKG